MGARHRPFAQKSVAGFCRTLTRAYPRFRVLWIPGVVSLGRYSISPERGHYLTERKSSSLPQLAASLCASIPLALETA